ncbi:MAG TPA: DUF2007 domain-containing protein [Anaerovoracaceae bacterium]|nr:DUF2007 domain-containing protein [Anaerovoracaceae bacterium]
MMVEKKDQKEWRDGVYLCTAKDSFEADILESKLRSEGIPSIKKFKGASNFLEIFMGSSTAFSIDLYVPEEALEDAKNIIVAVPLTSDELPEEPIDFDSLTEEELDELIGTEGEEKNEGKKDKE